ncbi:MAG: T9SS type A sorting domain-containing protein [Bacteroidetes bacterium]|nr:T9SS type A sorting domain-containing protein [Bacteroidota bacterium]
MTIAFSSQQVNTETVQIYNSIGTLVKTVDLKQFSTVINVSELSIGIYFIQLKNHPQQTVKFIKQ